MKNNFKMHITTKNVLTAVMVVQYTEYEPCQLAILIAEM